MEIATFAAGCFWGVEHTFRQIEGVAATTVGYMGGNFANPTYQNVCSDQTGHAEVVRVEFDPNMISYEKLLTVFWHCHNPTTLNRQGPDIGSQYRSAIYYYSDAQKKTADTLKQQLNDSGEFAAPIVTEILPAMTFYQAEEYHQNYYDKQGGGSCKL